jgi:hypothetical protein
MLPGRMSVGLAQAKKDSSDKVAVQASATATDAAGNQQITLKLTIARDWYLYANPVGNDDLKGNETTVRVTSQAPTAEVKTTYPPGKAVNKYGTDFRIYEGEVTLTTLVRRAPGDTGPLQVTIGVNSCSNQGICLKPGAIKVTVPGAGN